MQTGRPRDDDSQVWINYKKCKKWLRNQLRQSKYQYEVDYIRKINDDSIIDQKLLCFLVNKRIKTRQSTP